MSPVQRAHPDRIACDQEAPGGMIPEGKGEDAIELAHTIRAAFTIQPVDNLAIRSGLEIIRLDQPAFEFAVVVDLAVDREDELAIGRADRLRATGRIDNGETFVDEDRTFIDMHPAPVRPAVTLALGKFQGQPTQADEIVTGLQAKHSEYRAHDGDSWLIEG